MPELPEVETVVRGLRESLVGRTFVGSSVYWPRELHLLSPGEFSDRLRGQRVEALRRRGKYVVFGLNRDVLLIHLKMSGRLYIAATGQVTDDDRWVRVSLVLDDGHELRFSDARKFGRVYLVADEGDVTGALGPEPLDAAFTLEVFRARLTKRRGAIKPLLLNQQFLAGVGNIYADEALWRARIDPRRIVATLEADEIERLHSAIRTVLEQGIEHEGTTVSWYRKPDGTPGGFQSFFKVYDRAEQPCSNCGTPIRKLWLGQRGTHFCPVCQR